MLAVYVFLPQMPIKVAGIVESFGTKFAADIFQLFIFWPMEQPEEETRMV